MSKIDEKLIKEFNATGPCVVNIDLLDKHWDHRFVLSEYDNKFRFIKYLRRGSGCCSVKCDISNEQAGEIIDRLNLEKTTDAFFRKSATWRKKGMSELDMRRYPKKKSI